MSKHQWVLDEHTGKIDIFMLDIGHHNGPMCKVCGKSDCHHCNTGIYDEECPGATQ